MVASLETAGISQEVQVVWVFRRSVSGSLEEGRLEMRRESIFGFEMDR